MKKFIISLLMCLMIWTVVDRYFNDYHYCMYYILENENNARELIEAHDYKENPLIVGDKVEIITNRWGAKKLQRVE